MIISDYHAVLHPGKKVNKTQTPFSFSTSLLPPFPSTSKPGNKKERSYTLMNIRAGTNIHASCPDGQQKVHLQ